MTVLPRRTLEWYIKLLMAESRSTDDALKRQLSLSHAAQINSQITLKRSPNKRQQLLIP